LATAEAQQSDDGIFLLNFFFFSCLPVIALATTGESCASCLAAIASATAEAQLCDDRIFP
jgi:hypothetical protein